MQKFMTIRLQSDGAAGAERGLCSDALQRRISWQPNAKAIGA